MTDAAFWLGLISMAFAIPMIVLTPFGGAIADRFPRIRLLWIVQILYITASAILSIIVITGVVQVWMLVVYSFINGVVLAVDSPTRHALLPDIVTREQLPAAVSLNSVAFTGAGLMGPALGGALIPLIGVGGVLSFNAISCIAILVALKKLRDVPDHSRYADVAGERSDLDSRGDGVCPWFAVVDGADGHLRRVGPLDSLLQSDARGFRPGSVRGRFDSLWPVAFGGRTRNVDRRIRDCGPARCPARRAVG